MSKYVQDKNMRWEPQKTEIINSVDVKNKWQKIKKSIKDRTGSERIH